MEYNIADMTKPISEDRKLRTALDLGRRAATRAAFPAMFLCTLLYVFVIIHTPLSVFADAAQDDGLYISLARYLSEGKWLGPFNQLTLAKGPGYPIFLASAHWLGISLSLAHALFHCGVVVLLVILCRPLIASSLLSALLFGLLLWNPMSFSADILRVVRDQIYYGQVLVFFAAFSYLLLDFRAQTRTSLAVLAGVSLGWIFLTREEASWILPGIAVLVMGAALRGYAAGRLRPLAIALLVTVVSFGGTQLAFTFMNWKTYRTFIGVDSKEANFQDALRQIHGVRSGGVKPFVAVTRAAREEIYAVSPSFAALKDMLDGPLGATWASNNCQYIPATCGEIGSGWFMWALRDAAAAKGMYASPARASTFFRAVAEEISGACKQGRLECLPLPVAELPNVSWQQISAAPRRLLDTLWLLLYYRSGLDPSASRGGELSIESAVRFLNYPRHAAPADYAPPFVLSGWFYSSGDRWVSLKFVEGTDIASTIDVTRLASPDIAKYFNDPAASMQRFLIRGRCKDDCRVQISTENGTATEATVAKLLVSPSNLHVAGGTFHVDTTASDMVKFAVGRPQALARYIRGFLGHAYGPVFRPLLAVGLIAFLLAASLYYRRSVWNACFLVALSCWLLVLARCALLVVIDVTTFPAVFPLYLTPAYYLAVCGAIFSIAAFLQLRGSRKI